MVRKNLINIIREEATIDIPEDLAAFVRRNLLDAIGCTLAGVQTELAREVIDEIKEGETSQESTIIGDGGQISAQRAFRLNSTLGRLEVHKEKPFIVPRHPGQQLLFAALSAGEQLGLDLKMIIDAIVVVYELILQVGHGVLPIAWPEDEPLPKTGMEVCFTPQGLASIIRTIIKEQIVEEEGNVFTQLLLQTLAFLASPRFPCDSDFLNNDELVGHCRELISQMKFTKSALHKCLIRKSGFQLTFLDHFMEAPTRVLIKALHGSNIQLERIERIIFKGILWLDCFAKETDEDVKAKLAYTTCLCISRLDPYQSWYLNGLADRPIISELAKKVLLVEDIWDLAYTSESGKYRCIVQINHADGIPLVGKLIYDIYEIRHFRTKDQFKEQFKSDAIGMIGLKQTEKLCAAILDENIKLAEIMKLTYPKRWPADVIRKWGWLVKH